LHVPFRMHWRGDGVAAYDIVTHCPETQGSSQTTKKFVAHACVFSETLGEGSPFRAVYLDDIGSPKAQRIAAQIIRRQEP
jgi:hypothetical protein